MSEHPRAPRDASKPSPAEAEERRRRRARVFGDVLPETTADERGDGGAEQDTGADEWLRRQVPPHHG